MPVTRQDAPVSRRQPLPVVVKDTVSAMVKLYWGFLPRLSELVLPFVGVPGCFVFTFGLSRHKVIKS